MQAVEDRFKGDPVAAGQFMTDDELVEPLRQERLQEGVVDYDPYVDRVCPILNKGLVQAGLNEDHLLRRVVVNLTHVRSTMPAPSQEKCGFRLCHVYPTYDQLAKGGTVPSVLAVEADKSGRLLRDAIQNDPLMLYSNVLHEAVPEVEISLRTTWMPFLLTNGPKPSEYCNKKIIRILELSKAAVKKEFHEEKEEREKTKANVQTGLDEAREKDIAALASGALTVHTDTEQIEEMMVEERSKQEDSVAAAAEAAAARVEATVGKGGALAGFKFDSGADDAHRVQNLDTRFRDARCKWAVMSIIPDNTEDDDVEPLLIIFDFVENVEEGKTYMLRLLSKCAMFQTHLIPMGEWVNPYDALEADVEHSAGSQMGRMLNAALRIGNKSIEQREAKMREHAKKQVEDDKLLTEEEKALEKAGRKMKGEAPLLDEGDSAELEAKMQSALDSFYSTLV